MTITEAQGLHTGQIVYHRTAKDSKGHPCKLKVTSVKTWKREPARVEVHTKYGLYGFDVFREMTSRHVGAFMIPYETPGIEALCLTPEECQ